MKIFRYGTVRAVCKNGTLSCTLVFAVYNQNCLNLKINQGANIVDEQNQNEASNSNEIIEQLKQSEKNLLESQKKLVSYLLKP